MKPLIASTDATVVIAFWLGVGVAGLALLLFVMILVLRQIVLRRERTHAAAVAYWKKILITETGLESQAIPKPRRRDMSGFLQVWNEVHEPLRGGTTPFLTRVAGEIGLEQRLQRQLDKGGFHTRLVAIIAMGHIKTRDSFDRVERFIDDSNPTVSLCAARALMQIDPSRAISQFVPHIVSRSDWSRGSIATVLSEAGAEAVSRELSEATLQANVEIAPRLIRFLSGVNPDAARPIIRKMLDSSHDERLISTCLQVMSSKEDLDCVRALLTHPRWHVRMQAAVTLGRLGVEGDEKRLIDLLSDKQWWVRYRAAQALTKLGFIGREGMRRIETMHTDLFARDIIRHVLAEQEMGIETGRA